MDRCNGDSDPAKINVVIYIRTLSIVKVYAKEKFLVFRISEEDIFLDDFIKGSLNFS